MRRLRKAKNLTLEGLQKRTSIPLPRLRAVDAGDYPPYLSEALRIATALDTTVDALARGTAGVRMSGVYRSAVDKLPTNCTRTEEQ